MWRDPQSPQPSSLQLRPQTLEQNPYCAQQEFLTHGIYECKKIVFLLPFSLGRWFICHTATVPRVVAITNKIRYAMCLIVTSTIIVGSFDKDT